MIERKGFQAAEEIGRHVQGVRIDEVTHACPDCDLGTPRQFCRWCYGGGQLSESRLAEWQRAQNGKLAQGRGA